MPWAKEKIIDRNEEILPAFHFIGTYNTKMHHDYGAICVRDDQLYVFDGIRDWTALGHVANLTYEAPKVKRFITNCPNCGAPLRGNKCIYCDTEVNI